MSNKILSDAPNAADFYAISQKFFPQNFPFSVRLQTDADGKWVENLHARAFGPGRFARTAFRVREALQLDPKLCLIAEHEEKPVGSVWMTPISLGADRGFLLGPLAIDPDFRSQGLGKMLVGLVTKMALDKNKSGFVVLVGDESYYSPMGFVCAKPGAIAFPGPVDQRRILVCSAIKDHAKTLNGTII